jgi:hypothetical protein
MEGWASAGDEFQLTAQGDFAAVTVQILMGIYEFLS